MQVERVSKNRVVVAMLTFNRSKTAIRSIRSIIQDSGLEKLVIFDDGSNPSEFANLQNFCKQYSEIDIYRGDRNMGYQYNLKRALTYLSDLNCAGRLVFLCESDMLLTKNWSSYIFEAFKSSPESVALSVMLHRDQLEKNRSKIFRDRCLTGYDSRFPGTKGRRPFGNQCFKEMPDEQRPIQFSRGSIRYVSNSVGSIVFRQSSLKKIVPYLHALDSFPSQEDAWLSYMCFKVNNYNPKSFMVMDPGIALTFGEDGLHGPMSINNVRWLGSIFWSNRILAIINRLVILFKKASKKVFSG